MKCKVLEPTILSASLVQAVKFMTRLGFKSLNRDLVDLVDLVVLVYLVDKLAYAACTTWESPHDQCRTQITL
jgi:hypothetical protein